MANANEALMFISLGMDIQTTQTLLAADAHKFDVTPDLEGYADLDLYNRRAALDERIHTFRQLQSIYMPELRAVLTPRECQRLDFESWCAENTALFLPSEITNRAQRERTCVKGLCDIEVELRSAELCGALRNIHCLTMHHAILCRQRGTKQQQLILQVDSQLEYARHRKEEAEAALKSLQG
ncbi:hypothetical protein B0H13DRAFT_2365094 [Mycena leptocephala]|nr:hypothetical protein B0H13DRAFT_2365094 [Mycena leptocephala]